MTGIRDSFGSRWPKPAANLAARRHQHDFVHGAPALRTTPRCVATRANELATPVARASSRALLYSAGSLAADTNTILYMTELGRNMIVRRQGRAEKRLIWLRIDGLDPRGMLCGSPHRHRHQHDFVHDIRRHRAAITDRVMQAAQTLHARLRPQSCDRRPVRACHFATDQHDFVHDHHQPGADHHRTNALLAMPCEGGA